MVVERHRDYSPLREAHANALEALNNHIDQTPGREAGAEGRAPETSQQVEQGHDVTAEAGPSRPEGHYGDRPGWTDRGDMPSQQRSAMDSIRAHHEANPEHAAKLEALNQHIENPGRDQSQEPQLEPNRENDIER